MKFDTLLYTSLEEAGSTARAIEAAGFSGCWIAETGHNPFFPLLLAARETNRMNLATGIAVAFARSPMTLAQEAWDLQAASKGRFILGLGSQVQAHITKRFSMPWDKPVERMRDMILALRTIWKCFQDGGPLRHEGPFYKHTLMTPFFSPGPIEHPNVPIFLAAVGPLMTELAAELADGIVLHAFTNALYFETVTLPAIERGLAKAGRKRSDFVISGPIFMITGDEDISGQMEALVRQQIAFYGSTPAYSAVLDCIGHLDLHKELHRLSREGKWKEMSALIPNDVVETFAVKAEPMDLPGKLRRRYADYDRLVSYIPIPNEHLPAFKPLIRAVEAEPSPTRP